MKYKDFFLMTDLGLSITSAYTTSRTIMISHMNKGLQHLLQPLILNYFFNHLSNQSIKFLCHNTLF